MGLVLSRQLIAAGVELGHADPTLMVLGHDGVRVLDQRRKSLKQRDRPAAATAAWYAPEYAQGMPTDARTSVFNVAMTMVGLLVGRSPFLRENVIETLRAAMHGDWSQPLGALRSDLPLDLIALLSSATARTPGQRPESLRAFMRFLEPFAPAGPDEAWSRLVKATLSEPASTPVPESDEGRLVRADELEEQGFDLEARWVRLECHVSRASGAERSALRQTLAVLSAELGPERVAELSRATIEACPLVVGGRCPGRWELLEPVAGVHRRCHECGTSVVHVLDVQHAQSIVHDCGTVAVDAAAGITPGSLRLTDEEWGILSRSRT